MSDVICAHSIQLYYLPLILTRFAGIWISSYCLLSEILNLDFFRILVIRNILIFFFYNIDEMYIIIIYADIIKMIIRYL